MSPLNSLIKEAHPWHQRPFRASCMVSGSVGTCSERGVPHESQGMHRDYATGDM